MKNQNIVITALAGLFALTTFGVRAQEKVWSFGPEVGVSVSKYGQDATANEFKAGAIGGLFLTYSIKNTFAITTKVLYSQRGAYLQPSDNKQSLNYVEVPIIARFFLNEEGKFRPNFFVGPSFAFLTGVSNKIGQNERVGMSNYENTFNTFDFGVTGGMGLNILIMDETYFIIDARYTHGVSDITKSNLNVGNRSFGLSAGISFGI